VQKKLPYITRELFIGKDATICTLYPSMQTMRDAILYTFAIHEEDTKTRHAFLQSWGLQTLQELGLGGWVAKQMRDTRGNYTRIAREELYHLLHILKPPLNASMTVKEEWKEALDTLRNEDKWCIAELPNGQINPYGSTTIHGAVVKVIVGSHYDPSKKVDLTLEQAFFFFYLLELAMEDKNLSHVDGRVQAHNMKLLEDKIVNVIPMLKKFQILDHPHEEEYA
jgi:hypothetical protein